MLNYGYSSFNINPFTQPRSRLKPQVDVQKVCKHFISYKRYAKVYVRVSLHPFKEMGLNARGRQGLLLLRNGVVKDIVNPRKIY